MRNSEMVGLSETAWVLLQAPSMRRSWLTKMALHDRNYRPEGPTRLGDLENCETDHQRIHQYREHKIQGCVRPWGCELRKWHYGFTRWDVELNRSNETGIENSRTHSVANHQDCGMRCKYRAVLSQKFSTQHRLKDAPKKRSRGVRYIVQEQRAPTREQQKLVSSPSPR